MPERVQIGDEDANARAESRLASKLVLNFAFGLIPLEQQRYFSLLFPTDSGSTGVNYQDGAASGCTREHRLKVFQPIQLETAAGTARAHLLNLSRTGALIHCADAPDRGSVVRVTLGGTANLARVIWRDGKRFGVAFAGKLAPTQIEDTLAAQNDLVTKAVAGAA